MRELRFTFDDEVNGWISEVFSVDDAATVHIELESRAPVVTLKQERDGGWANYGQTPESGTAFEIHVTTNREEQLRLATPVVVTKCFVV